jgi:hypothetical protein
MCDLGVTRTRPQRHDGTLVSADTKASGEVLSWPNLACAVDSCWEVFDVDRALVVRVVWPRRGHGSFGVGGGWR